MFKVKKLEEKVIELEKRVQALEERERSLLDRLSCERKYSCFHFHHIKLNDCINLIPYNKFDLYINGLLIKRCVDKYDFILVMNNAQKCVNLSESVLPFSIHKITDILCSRVTSVVYIVTD